MSSWLAPLAVDLAMVAFVIGGGGVVGKVTAALHDRKNDREAQRDLALDLAWIAEHNNKPVPKEAEA